MTKKINYLYIGGHKCGSTWLHDMLVQHPEIDMPKQKEPRFFDIYYKKGFNFYYNLWGGEGLMGEFSTSYFIDKGALHRIREHNPDVKLILSLRNPLDRTISHYKHWNRVSGVGNIEINQYLKDVPCVLDRSYYYKHLKEVFSLFQRENIKIILFDDIKNNPKEVVRSVFSYLEVGEGYLPKNLEKKTGEGFVPKFIFLEKFRQYVFSALYQANLQHIINFLRSVGVGRLFRKINSRKDYDIRAVDGEVMINFIEELKELQKLFIDNDYEKLNTTIQTWISSIERDFK